MDINNGGPKIGSYTMLNCFTGLTHRYKTGCATLYKLLAGLIFYQGRTWVFPNKSIKLLHKVKINYGGKIK